MRQIGLVMLIFATLALAGCGGGSNPGSSYSAPPPPIQGSMASVDFGTTDQTIRGFGGADAWINLSGGAPEAQALFGLGSDQIGLSILRARIDPSSTTPGPQWDAEVANAQLAIAAGSSVSIIATPWTPPAVWKSNNSTIMGSLNLANYGDYANYLESFVNYMATNGVNLYAISMQNEPDANVTYESCVWTPQQMDNWVASYGSTITTRLMMPESEGFNTAYSDPALADPNAVGKIGIIAGHLYGTTPTYYANAASAGKEVWMTEHYLNPAGSVPAIGDAVQMAKEINDSLTIGDYNAYVWWWVEASNPDTGLVESNNSPNYFGWAMAQYARFIRPGYVRVNATYSPTTNVYVSAFMGNSHFVIVVINMGAVRVTQPFTLNGQTLTSLTPYETTASATVAPQSPVTVTSGQFSYDLPAQSIVTFVQ